MTTPPVSRRLKKAIKLAWAAHCARRGRPAARLAPGHAVILCYHRVVPQARLADVYSSPHILVTLEAFTAQIKYLATHYTLLPLAELALRRARGEAWPARAVAVTFDDGWRDNFLYAFPILRMYQAPATVFVTAGLVGTNAVFWPEVVRFLFAGMAPEQRPPAAAWRAWTRGQPAPIRRARDLRGVIEALKFLPAAARDEFVARLRSRLGDPTFPQEGNALLRWDEARAMQACGIAFGSHGMSHEILTLLPAEQMLAELRESRERIAEELGFPVNTLAYPNGNFNAAVVEAARRAGYHLAGTTREGRNGPATDLLQLKRINVSEDRFADLDGNFSPALFDATLAGLL